MSTEVSWLKICSFKYLLISNSELSLRLLIVFGETLELFNWIALKDRDKKSDILFRVLMARLSMLSGLFD